jgi:hypothetical protein
MRQGLWKISGTGTARVPFGSVGERRKDGEIEHENLIKERVRL